MKVESGSEQNVHSSSWSVRSETHPHAELNVLKSIEKYFIEQESHPAKELLPYKKIKFDIDKNTPEWWGGN